TVNYSSWSGTETYPFIDTDGPLTPPTYSLPAPDPGRAWLDISTPQDLIWENSAVLPVTLRFFEGQTVGKTNHLSWATELEVENAGFRVQRSGDGVSWEDLGFVEAAGAAAAYAYTDTAPLTGNNFYRLRQEDLDGATELSGVVRLHLAPASPPNAFPNPVHNQLNLRGFSGTIRLIDFAGRPLQTLAPNTAVLDVSTLAPGQYVLVAEDGETVRFVRR
ncbi:MAG: T9SS type A sorting domain-containing protein, partial [Bacteroidota bacterium]